MKQTEADIKLEILAEIEKAMKKKGISQGELGRQLDISRNHINSYLRGRNLSLSLDRVLDMAEIVDLEVRVSIKKRLKTSK